MSVNYLKMLTHSDKLPIYTDIETLDIYCEYLLNDSSRHVNYANLTNLKEYIDRMDTKLLVSSDSKMARYEFIRLYLEARIEHGIVKRKMVLRYIYENLEPKYRKIVQREILNSIDPDTLSKKDVEFINDLVFSQLNMIFLHEYKAPISRMLTGWRKMPESSSFGIALQISSCSCLWHMMKRCMCLSKIRSLM